MFMLYVLLISKVSYAQFDFDYTIDLQPVEITNLQGLHSYAFGQADGKWLIVGGRTDGLHPRQPFASFPVSHNNTYLYVIDVTTKAFWSAPLSSLATGLQEQLQATNMNFYQDEDTLYIIGGYAFSATANDHITFPYLTAIEVSAVIDAVIAGSSVVPYFKQVSDPAFAITGGQLGKLGNTYYLVGGHQFDGRYNPMGHNTYSQTYSEQIRKFAFDNSGPTLSFNHLANVTDAVHLHRRDYNLMPQVFTDGSLGYMISSGVFQTTSDLPFLYPVIVTEDGILAETGFNQYLSNYHSASTSLYDSVSNTMHHLFFGGMSQYYHNGDSLVKDDRVPFVKTISRVTRSATGVFQEFQEPTSMPELQGASAEFIPNKTLPHYSNEAIKLSAITDDTTLLGHIFGGIYSNSLNPFSVNQTNQTSADNTVYAVRLIKGASLGAHAISGVNPYSFEVTPNPVSGKSIQLQYELPRSVQVHFMVTATDGQMLQQGALNRAYAGINRDSIVVDTNIPSMQMLFVTLVFDGKYFVTRKVVLQH